MKFWRASPALHGPAGSEERELVELAVAQVVRAGRAVMVVSMRRVVPVPVAMAVVRVEHVRKRHRGRARSAHRHHDRDEYRAKRRALTMLCSQVVPPHA